ncbi:hypothetical protein HBH56_090300 [Parastagonospora nodorum]|uniref:Uncharacterized protein n=1 Tax=Phaeosphaeria nodorum (strain SN15 / ATCC MYA-4574 / FGSC 10173) TaxID=321614 RepID=Q0UVB6_PHANO|nr:hypothetical protein SNOG_04298 [Parastagonospora nodorum SN15]KAH3914516.1 hypothetical protein HBH56_090300 [Parastagonospora nodorum]EAT88058.2 hypothetical protein SNOG_04298 [Parastagonospora nodorum SN15]KAH3936119.1 hypothetical protein HBH54_024940 [Parastagonospora nodorum]KAH4162295.1 hypothetical protein HBH44_087800 [Parastagonospora nodorum]KAH4350435.1 hypothetical protein HBH98_049000 [Parastagonospora nodorum]
MNISTPTLICIIMLFLLAATIQANGREGCSPGILGCRHKGSRGIENTPGHVVVDEE